MVNAKPIDSMSKAELTDYVNQWQPLEVNKRGGIFVKPITIKEDALGHKVFWARLETYDKPPSKTDLLYVIDCELGKIGGAGYIKYNQNNKIIAERKLPTELAPLEYPNPDSFQNIFIQGICK